MQNNARIPLVAGQRAVTCGAALICAAVLGCLPAATLDPRWIFLASIAVFGLAHGSCDIWLPGWVFGRTLGWRFNSLFCLAYLGVAGLVLVLWQVQTGLALVGFLVLTAWHWGSADAMLTGSVAGDFTLLAWGRGFMVLAAPAAFHPDATFKVLARLDPGAFNGSSHGGLHTMAIVALILGVGLQCRVWPRPSKGRYLLAHHLESFFLLLMFAALAPLLATALYFIWFHAWRHILRLCRWQSRSSGAGLWRQVGRFHRAALPCFLGALGLLWCVAWWWPGDLVRAYLILLSAVTLPHALLVYWLDQTEMHRRASAAARAVGSTSGAGWVSIAP